MGRYSKAFSIKKQFQSPNCQTCQGQSRTLKKIVFLELFLRIIEDEKWNLFEKLGQLRTPNEYRTHQSTQPACYRFAQEIFCLTLNRQGAVKESKKKYGGERGGTPLALLGGSVVEVRSPKMLPKH